MRTRISVFAVVLAVLALPAPGRAADRTGFQLQVDGLLASPTGSLPSAAGARLSSLFASGGGYAVTASMGVTKRWFGALRVGSFHGTDKSNPFQFSDLPLAAGGTLQPGSGPYDLRRDLEAVPVHVLLQYRRETRQHVGYFAEVGAGMISFTEKMGLRNGAGELFNIVGYQRELSYAAGAGLAVGVPGNFDVVGGARYEAAPASDGAIWQSGDHPAFLTGSIGIRYPRVTH